VTDPIDRLDEIKERWSLDSSLPRPVPWGLDDVVWLVQEVERLRASYKEAREVVRLRDRDVARLSRLLYPPATPPPAPTAEPSAGSPDPDHAKH
jgi:hypothetical protein